MGVPETIEIPLPLIKRFLMKNLDVKADIRLTLLLTYGDFFRHYPVGHLRRLIRQQPHRPGFVDDRRPPR
jgi:hypothetical protein